MEVFALWGEGEMEVFALWGEGEMEVFALWGDGHGRDRRVLPPPAIGTPVKWLMAAACAGENPVMFDHVTYPQASEALRICGNCLHVQDCMDWVRPNKSAFDGVAAGVVWRNGYRVRPDNSTREDRLLRIRGEELAETTIIPEILGQGTLPFD